MTERSHDRFLFNRRALLRKIRLAVTGDASLTSTDHPLQIGPDDGLNIIADNNEIMARNDGNAANLHLNVEGGAVTINNKTVPYIQHGRTSVSFTSGEGSVTFPVAYTAALPAVIAQVNLATGVQQTQHINTISLTGFVIDAWRGGVAEDSVSRTVTWVAVGAYPT